MKESTVTVTAGLLRLREEPSLTGGVICELKKGQELEVTAGTSVWLAVTTEAGVDGFVLREHVTEISL